MPNAYSLILDSPLGRLGIVLDGDALCRIDFLPAQTRVSPAAGPAARRVERALRRYFRTGEAGAASLPLRLQGTPFQQRVWRALQAIPRGQVRTYGELAARLGSGARAVGNACRHNPIPLLVPCHRVVAASGLGGYAGRTAGPVWQRKRWLLRHEGAIDT